ncbi:MAG TPA: DUF3857 and transglutaminase domain-containing protein [Acidobacteriaceae bacterium]|nr:DUF3857 and transglutaminase domain-containing protein [Acidobacteriaceae bacterium]
MQSNVAAGRGRAGGRLAMLLVGAAVFGGGVAARAGNPFGSQPVPDWVKTAAQQKLPEFHGNPKAVVLLDETTYTVDAKGQAVEHVRRVVKILRPQGRDYGYPWVWYDKDSKVLSLHVWSIDAAGHEYTLKDNEIVDLGQPGVGGDMLYSDDRAKAADPPGRDPGGIIAYEYEKRERPYLAETNWEFQDGLPRMQQSFTLALPAGYTYTTTWARHAKVNGIDLENHSYRWEMNDEPAIDLDQVPMAPEERSQAARMTVHYAGPGLMEPQDGTWQGIGEWYEGLESGRVVSAPDIAAKAAALTAGKTDFYDKAEAIGEFVQQTIRYVEIKMGVGGYQPHAAEDIFRGRYGDCKDKATLLSAMLSSVGIHSAQVLVDTERGVDPDAPSIVADHMIGAIEIPKGYESPKLHSVVTAKTGKRYLIFDPTWERTPFGQLEDKLQGSYGVLIEGNDSQVIELPVMDPALNTIRRSGKFELSADGSLKGSVTDLRFGDLAEYRRRVFSSEGEKKQTEYMNRVIAQDFTGASMTGLKVENVDALNKDLTTTFDLQASHFGNFTGPLLMVRPRVLGSYELDVDRKPRAVEINLEQTMQGTDEYDIELPQGYVVDELPDPVKIDVGFASYVSSTELHGRVLHYRRTYTVKQVTVPATKYEAVQQLAAAIASDEGSQAILKRGN